VTGCSIIELHQQHARIACRRWRLQHVEAALCLLNCTLSNCNSVYRLAAHHLYGSAALTCERMPFSSRQQKQHTWPRSDKKRRPRWGAPV
jgi:hypothetical protein